MPCGGRPRVVVGQSRVYIGCETDMELRTLICISQNAVARLAAGEYLLTAEAEPDKVTARRDGRLRVAQ